jgi:hypothetical protein
MCLCAAAAVDWKPEDEVRVHVVALDGSKVSLAALPARHGKAAALRPTSTPVTL